jgi:hypothetical protein
VDEPRRNDVIDQQLRRAFAAQGGALSGGHVDAEAAAAWMERRLDATASRAIEAHVADCPDCQAMLATLARMTPDDVAAPEGLAWWRRLRAGWLVPTAVAAAAALVIWVAVPQQRGASTPGETNQARDDRAALSASAVPPSAPATAATPEAPAAQAEPPEVERKALQQQRVGRGAPPAPSQSAPAVAPPPPPAAERRERFADAGASPQPPPAAATPAESDKASAKPDAAAPIVNAQRETITVTGESPALPPSPRQEAAAGASTRALGSLAGRAALNRADGLLIIAADGAARWRRTGSVIEFAPRGDAPFSVATLPVAADAISAGSSPGGTVCWLAGRGGVVLVAIDGLRFTRVTTPSSVDLVAITATDGRSAIVTTTVGRRYRTTDLGATWAPL